MLVLYDIKGKKLVEAQFCSTGCVQTWGELKFGNLFFDDGNGDVVQASTGWSESCIYRHSGFAVCTPDSLDAHDLNSYCRHCISCGTIANKPKCCSYHVGEVCSDRNFMVTESARLVAKLFCDSKEKSSLTDAIWYSIERVLSGSESGHLLHPELILKLAVEGSC